MTHQRIGEGMPSVLPPRRITGRAITCILCLCTALERKREFSSSILPWTFMDRRGSLPQVLSLDIRVAGHLPSCPHRGIVAARFIRWPAYVTAAIPVTPATENAMVLRAGVPAAGMSSLRRVRPGDLFRSVLPDCRSSRGEGGYSPIWKGERYVEHYAPNARLLASRVVSPFP